MLQCGMLPDDVHALIDVRALLWLHAAHVMNVQHWSIYATLS